VKRQKRIPGPKSVSAGRFARIRPRADPSRRPPSLIRRQAARRERAVDAHEIDLATFRAR